MYVVACITQQFYRNAHLRYSCFVSSIEICNLIQFVKFCYVVFPDLVVSAPWYFGGLLLKEDDIGMLEFGLNVTDIGDMGILPYNSWEFCLTLAH